jgi:hypothetical protein
MKKVCIRGKQYPFRLTMGAMLLFKRETGREVTELQQSDLSDVVMLLWCCVRSSSRADGIDFDMSIEDFADCIEPGDIAAWQAGFEKMASGMEFKESTNDKKKR